MMARHTMVSRSFGPAALIRSYPFLSAALLCHAVLLAGFFFIDRSLNDAARRAEILRETAKFEERAQVVQVRNLVKEMEAIDREMRHGAAEEALQSQAPEKAVTKDELERRAEELIGSIERKDREARAQKLAELLKIPVADAEAKLKREAEQQKVADPNEDNSQAGLKRRAELALTHERLRGANGVGVALPGTVGFGYGTGVAAANPSAYGQEYGPFRDGKGYSYDGDKRIYGAMQVTDALAPGTFRLGAGRSFGSGGVAADRVFVDSWYLIGPFQGVGAQSQDADYPPEQEIDLDAAYRGKDGQLLRWQYMQFSRYPIVPPIRAENAVYYGFTELDLDKERDVVFAMGADDDAKVWLNGRLIWKSGRGDKPWYHANFKNEAGSRIAQMNLSEVNVPVHLRKGHNTVLFKLYNGPMNLFFSLVISK